MAHFIINVASEPVRKSVYWVKSGRSRPGRRQIQPSLMTIWGMNSLSVSKGVPSKSRCRAFLSITLKIEMSAVGAGGQSPDPALHMHQPGGSGGNCGQGLIQRHTQLEVLCDDEHEVLGIRREVVRFSQSLEITSGQKPWETASLQVLILKFILPLAASKMTPVHGPPAWSA